MFTVSSVHTNNESSAKLVPRVVRICCQFVVVIRLRLTDGETLGRLPLKGVINRTWERASALTPCWGCLPGPRSRGQCLPFTPRYSRRLPTCPCRRTRTPWGRRANQAALFRPAPPLAALCLFASLPGSSVQMNCRRNCHRLLCWVGLLSAAPSLSSTLSVSAVYVQVIFCFESLQRKLMCPWRERLCL